MSEPSAAAVGLGGRQSAVDPWVVVTLVLRPRADTASPDPDLAGRATIRQRQPLSRADLGRVRGAHPDDLAAAQTWAAREGLEVVDTSLETRSLRIAGPLSRLSEVLAATVDLDPVPDPPGRRLRTGPAIPVALRGAVVAVLGLDTGPFARTTLRRLPLPDPTVPLAQAAPFSFAPPQVAQLYQYPSSAPASGRCIGLLELGGGYTASDLTTYFAGLGLPVPEVAVVGVAGGANHPTGNSNGPDGEVTLDLEVAGSAAPGARLAAYFAPNTDQGFLAAVQAAVHDRQNSPCVLSISWGGPEANWPAATIVAFEQVFEDAALVGMTVCVAAGDNGSGDGLAGGLAHVDYPAASPYVLACGGTRLKASAGDITSEVVWNDQPQDGATGGGISAVFPLPTWQQAATVPPSVNPGGFRGRGVPDVAGDADPETGYRVLVGGQPAVFGGTSAVAPLWAALIAICSGSMGNEIGYLNPLLYESLAAEAVTRDITEGNNGAYSAGVGWDPCSGWGSPIGVNLLGRLRR